MLSQIRQLNSEIASNFEFYFSEVVITIEYLHQKAIIYRDLKPENIVLDKVNRGHVKLVDFGFAKHMKTLKTQTNCGTPAYVAPEVLLGSGHSYEVDIWSLGVLLCEIVSGTTPFTAESTQLVYEKINKC
jgi:serine/threonine protein kinase